MNLFLRIIGMLLPDGRAWSVTLQTQLRYVLEGVASAPADFKGFVDAINSDPFPFLTTQIPEWENQLVIHKTGPLSEDERRARLDNRWKALGGQGRSYLQGVFRGAGFDVYVHEFFEPRGSTDPVVTRNPLLVLGGGPIFIAACGEALMECGEASALCGNTSNPAGRILVNILDGVTYSVPIDSAEWPFVVYVGASVYPLHATIDAARKEELQDLMLRYCPGHLWIGELITYS